MVIAAVGIPALAIAPATNGDILPNVQELLVDKTSYQKPTSSTEAYYEPIQQPIQYIAKGSKTPQDESEVIKAYIRTLWGDKADLAIQIVEFESGFDLMAYNPETYAKAHGITRWSSCGLWQNNDYRCDDKTSVIYDWRYSTDLAYQKYLARGWQPWYNTAKKLGIIH